MASLFTHSDLSAPNPLSIVEQILSKREVPFERNAEEEVIAEFNGNWCDYRLWFTWQETLGALMFACVFDHKVPQQQRARLYPLLAQVNEKMWLGHFDYSETDQCIGFRYTMLLRGNKDLLLHQTEDLLDIALGECERFYPAFQSVLWGGKTADEALAIAMFDTVGEA